MKLKRKKNRDIQLKVSLKVAGAIVWVQVRWSRFMDKLFNNMNPRFRRLLLALIGLSLVAFNTYMLITPFLDSTTRVVLVKPISSPLLQAPQSHFGMDSQAEIDSIVRQYLKVKDSLANAPPIDSSNR